MIHVENRITAVLAVFFIQWLDVHLCLLMQFSVYITETVLVTPSRRMLASSLIQMR